MRQLGTGTHSVELEFLIAEIVRQLRRGSHTVGQLGNVLLADVLIVLADHRARMDHDTSEHSLAVRHPRHRHVEIVCHRSGNVDQQLPHPRASGGR
ncbi:hypothetical protein [Rhodococcoides fascians]|uniref:hypothetical protein n=1 Tax=Rhodococcoides fascians TaxID=1828 RepID=UPI001A94DF49|nr:hypothetical protein [Rhodococcus fascians]